MVIARLKAITKSKTKLDALERAVRLQGLASTARAVFRPANCAIQTLAPLLERICAERPAAHGQEPGHRLYATCDFDIVEVVEIDRDHHDSTRRVIGIDPKTVRHDRPPDHGVIPERPGLIMNHKKLYRLYREEGLSVRRRRGRERVRGSWTAILLVGIGPVYRRICRTMPAFTSALQETHSISGIWSGTASPLMLRFKAR